MMDFKNGLLLWFINFLIKKSASLADKFTLGCGVKSMSNQQLADELHKPIIIKSKKGEFILHLKIIFWVLI